MMTRRVAAVFVAVAMATTIVSMPATALAQRDNTAIAVNEKDDSYLFDLSIAIVRTLSGSVDSGNAAAAVSSCNDCRTVAAAIQIVLVMSDPDVVMPTNIAIAINNECQSCETLATAFQLVITTGGMVRIGADGHKAIARLQKELRDLLRDGEDLPLEELNSSISALVMELFEVVVAELEPIGPRQEDEESAGDEESPSSSASPSPSESVPSPSPSDSVTESPSPEVSANPSPSESTTPEPEESSSPSP